MKYFLFVMAAVLVSCQGSLSRVSRPQLGTIVTLTFFSDEDRAPDIAQAAFQEIDRIEGLMSPYRQESEVSRVNRAAGTGPVAVDRETFGLIRRSLGISEETDGAFDISFASLSRLWDFSRAIFVPPSGSAVAALLPLVDYRKVLLDPVKSTVAFGRQGMRIGLGGVAKGYAVERAVETLKKMGVDSAIVEAGGDLQVIGRKGRGPWVTGLRHPRRETVLLSIEMEEGESVATSGDYERFALHKGRRYHHIFDPFTGFPAGSGLISVSVLSRSAVLSDAYATAIFVMGLEKARRFLKRHGEIDVILADDEMNLYISGRLRGRIGLLEKAKVEWL